MTDDARLWSTLGRVVPLAEPAATYIGFLSISIGLGVAMAAFLLVDGASLFDALYTLSFMASIGTAGVCLLWLFHTRRNPCGGDR